MEDKLKTLISFMRTLRIAMSNIQLYSTTSAIVQDTVNMCYGTLIQILEQDKTLMLSESEKSILVDGKMLDFTGVEKGFINNFAETLISQKIRSITFKYGISKGELTAFLEVLSKRKRLAGMEGHISQLLIKKQISNIQLDEKIYVVADDKDKEKQGDNIVTQEQEVVAQESAQFASPDETTVSGQDAGSEIKGNTGSRKYASAGIGGIGQAGSMGQGEIIYRTKEEKLYSDVDNVLKKDRKSLLEETHKKALPQMLKDLDVIERTDLAGKVVDGFAENLDDTVPSVRLETVRSFKEFSSTIEGLSDKKIIGKLEDKFIDTEDKESEEQIYLELADLLEEGVNRLLVRGDYDKSGRILTMFQRHRTAKYEVFAERWQCAEKVLERIANSHFISILVSDLRCDDVKKQEQAYSIILKMEEMSIEPLIEALKETEDLHLRKVIAYALKRMGKEAIEKLLDVLSNETSPVEIKRIVEIIDILDVKDKIIETLKGVFGHYSSLVRKNILYVYFRIGSEEAKQLLAEAINDVDVEVQLEAIKLVGKLKCEIAVDVLIAKIVSVKLFSKEIVSEAVQEEICVSLGKIGHSLAITALFNTALSQSFLSFKSTKPLNVRLSAVMSLSGFSNNDAKLSLEKLSLDKNSQVKKAVAEALNRQAKLISQKGENLAQKVL